MQVTTPLGTAFIKLYFNNALVSFPIEKFQYTYSEESDDSCIIILNVLGENDPDNPMFHDLAIWIAVWGYVNTTNTVKRKMYLQNPKWDFSKTGRKVTLYFTEQAVILKQSKSKQAYKNATIVDAAKLIAQKRGLNLVIIKPNTNGFKDEGYVWSSVAGNSTVTQAGIDSNSIMQKQWAAQQQATEDSDQANFNEYQTALAKSNNPYSDLGPLINYVCKMQANKTDSHLLSEMGEQEPNGEITVETRDDNIILKYRNFNKTPYRSYTWANDAQFLDFIPESKARTKAGAAIATLQSTWDEKLKEYTHQALTLETTKQYLAKYMWKSGWLPNTTVISIDPKHQKTLTSSWGWEKKFKDDFMYMDIPGTRDTYKTFAEYEAAAQLVMDPNTPSETHIATFLGTAQNPAFSQSTQGSFGLPGTRADNTNTFQPAGMESITIGEARDILTRAIQDQLNSQHDETGATPKEALQKAINALNKANLQMNPATALFWGDTNHQTGIILTLLAVSKRYSGNYYIVKSTHTLDISSGYTVSDELCTQGSNIKMPTNRSAASLSTKQINTEVGKARNSQSSGTIKTATNLR